MRRISRGRDSCASCASGELLPAVACRSTRAPQARPLRKERDVVNAGPRKTFRSADTCRKCPGRCKTCCKNARFPWLGASLRVVEGLSPVACRPQACRTCVGADHAGRVRSRKSSTGTALQLGKECTAWLLVPDMDLERSSILIPCCFGHSKLSLMATPSFTRRTPRICLYTYSRSHLKPSAAECSCRARTTTSHNEDGRHHLALLILCKAMQNAYQNATASIWLF